MDNKLSEYLEKVLKFNFQLFINYIDEFGDQRFDITDLGNGRRQLFAVALGFD